MFLRYFFIALFTSSLSVASIHNKIAWIEDSGVMLVDREGKVWLWKQQDTPAELMEDFKDIKVKAVASSGLHALALDSFGRVWAWGQNHAGELGIPSSLLEAKIDENGWLSQPTLLPNLPEISALAVGRNFSFVLGWDGSLWGFGNAPGFPSPNLDHALLPSNTLTPKKLKRAQNGRLPPLQSVIAGQDHVLALDNNGKVWSWGHNNYRNKLGRNSNANRPTRIKKLHNIVQITAGDNSSFALNNKHQIWAFGDVHAGGNTKPRKIGDFRAQSIVAAKNRLAALDMSGFIWSWGYAIGFMDGCLGRSMCLVNNATFIEDNDGSLIMFGTIQNQTNNIQFEYHQPTSLSQVLNETFQSLSIKKAQ